MSCRRKDLPLGQDDARSAAREPAFWDELSQPAGASTQPIIRRPSCLPGWTFSPPRKIWIKTVVDGIFHDCSLDSGQTSVQPTWVGDGALMDSAFDIGFQSPNIQTFKDAFTLDQSADSGVYVAVVVTTAPLQDAFTLDQSTDPGAYTQTIFNPQTVQDAWLLDQSTDSGVYLIATVSAPAVQDAFTMDSSTDPGAYVERVFGAQTTQDAFTFDCSLDSGSYL